MKLAIDHMQNGLNLSPFEKVGRLSGAIAGGLALNKKSWRSWRSSRKTIEKQGFITPPRTPPKGDFGGLGKTAKREVGGLLWRRSKVLKIKKNTLLKRRPPSRPPKSCWEVKAASEEKIKWH